MLLQLSTSTKVSQQLSPQVMQHLNILSYTVTELQDFIQQQALSNPLFELSFSKIERPYDAYRLKNNKYTQNDIINQFYSKEKPSIHFLLEQIPLNCSPLQKGILQAIIFTLDERLFLTESTSYYARVFQVEEAYIESCLRILRDFEPFGVGAKNSIDFLLMHIEDDLTAPELAGIFLKNEMKALAKMEVFKLQKKYQVSIEEVKEAILYIKALPRVPTITVHETAAYIAPDIIVEKVDGQWLIQMNDQLLPSISVNTVYVELLQNTEPQYLKNAMREYTALVQGIEFRHQTLYAIMNYLLDAQQGFFERGRAYLKPMGLKEVAQALNVHESTISRAIRGKYMRTGFGQLAIQELFIKRVSDTTTDHVLKKIQQLIEQESKQCPYSDQQLVELLNEQKITISRRTVTKYREQLGIVSSTKRKYF